MCNKINHNGRGVRADFCRKKGADGASYSIQDHNFTFQLLSGVLDNAGVKWRRKIASPVVTRPSANWGQRGLTFLIDWEFLVLDGNAAVSLL